MINETENATLVRQEDVACRYAISLSYLCRLHELIITRRAPSNPRVFGFQRTQCQHRGGLMEAFAILVTGVPTVLLEATKVAHKAYSTSLPIGNLPEYASSS